MIIFEKKSLLLRNAMKSSAPLHPQLLFFSNTSSVEGNDNLYANIHATCTCTCRCSTYRMRHKLTL